MTDFLREGDTGPAVAALQEWLNANFSSYSKIPLEPQRYGPITVKVIAEFQRRAGVTFEEADGRIVGSRTWEALKNHGYSGSEVAHVPLVTPKDWTKVPLDVRMHYVLERLVVRYNYPVNGAAGVVGNLRAESTVIPNRLQGSNAHTPMTVDLSGRRVTLTAEEAVSWQPGRKGLGLAQWTTTGRREGLFKHKYEDRVLGAQVLFHMDAQIDYLCHELAHDFRSVRNILMKEGVTVSEASDVVVEKYERPSAMRDAAKRKRELKKRRDHSRDALKAYKEGTGS